MPRCAAATTQSRPLDSAARHAAGSRLALFIMILFLMALAGMWGIMYLMLLER